MSFELGLLTGLGKAAMRERESRTLREQQEREQLERQNARSLSMLQKFVETDNLLPDEARNVAARHLTTLAMNPKAKDTDFTKAVQDVWTIANQPRPSQSPQSIATEAARQIGTSQPNLAGWNAISPFSNMGGAVQSAARRLPEPEMVSGLLTDDERNARDTRQYESRLKLQQQYSGDPSQPKVIVVKGDDGNYIYNPTTGAPIGFDRFRTPTAPPKPPALSDFENFVEVSRRAWQAQNPGRQMTPQQEELLWIEAKKRFGQADDRPRIQPVTVQFTPNQPIDPLVQFYANEVQSGRRKPADIPKDYKVAVDSYIASIGGQTGEFLSSEARTRKSELETMILGLEETKRLLPNTPQATGPIDSMTYMLRSYAPAIFGDNDPNVITIRTELYAGINERLHQMSGAAISPSEYTRLLNELPNPRMSDQETQVRLKRFSERLKRIYMLRYGQGGVGDPSQFSGDVLASDNQTSTNMNSWMQSGGRAPQLPTPTPTPASNKPVSQMSTDELLRLAIGGGN